MKMITKTNFVSSSKWIDNFYCYPHDGFILSCNGNRLFSIWSYGWSGTLVRSAMKHKPKIIYED